MMDNCWRKACSSFFTYHFDDSVTSATHLQAAFEVHQTYTNLLSPYFSKGDFDMNSPSMAAYSILLQVIAFSASFDSDVLLSFGLWK